MSDAAAPKLKNISSWKLNKAEEEQLKTRVANGEEELTVKRALQKLKAEAALSRKTAANAVAQKSARQSQGSAKAKAKAPVPSQGDSASDAELNDATNKHYYALVQQDLATIFEHFGPQLATEFCLPIGCGQESGVQDVYDRQKGITSLKQHSVYRCSVSAFWINALSSATPGVPMSRKRVEDLSAFHFPGAQPKFMTDRMIEIACSEADLTDEPRNLQMISPEELLHSLLHACASAIKCLAPKLSFSIPNPCFEYVVSRNFILAIYFVVNDLQLQALISIG